MKKLKEIALVQSGITFRSRLEQDADGNVGVIQMKDLEDDNKVNLTHIMRIDLGSPKESHLLQKGDLVFRSRGVTNTAALLEEEVTNIALAAPLFKIRVKAGGVLPEYLWWFINQAGAQSYLTSRAKGTQVKMIGKQALEEMEIEVPSLEEQRKIATLYMLSQHEEALLERLKQKKRSFIDTVLIRAGTGNLKAAVLK